MANSTLTKQRSSVYRSTVALKSGMALSGLVMVGFLIAHMIGNLKIFQGQQAFDQYSYWLRAIGYPALPQEGFLWVMRVVLLVSIAVHIYAAVALTVRDRRARPVRYRTTKRVQRTYSSYTMRWGGVVIALFVVYHLLHLTTNDIAPGGAATSPYERVINGFRIWWVTASYILALLAVAFHLRHGIWSGLATLGFNTARRQRAINAAAVTLASLLFVGFALPPIAVMLGVVN